MAASLILKNLVKLTAQLPSLHHGGFVTCEPCDIPVNKRHLDMLYAHMTLSDKPHLGAITAKDRAEDSVAMARILHGAETFENNCVIMGNVNTNSPLMVDKVVTEAIMTYCGAGQGIVVVPFILSGAMGPVTTAASVAQALAEAMACCAFAQLVRPGAPFILGNFLSSMSLKSGAPTFGMPEPVMSNYAIGQLARRLGLPLRCGGGLTASKLPDAQAAAESADSMHSTALAGANFVLHSAGWLESGLVTSFEKLVIDADRLAPIRLCWRVWRLMKTPLAARRLMKLNRRHIIWAQPIQWRITRPPFMKPACLIQKVLSNGLIRARWIWRCVQMP